MGLCSLAELNVRLPCDRLDEATVEVKPSNAESSLDAVARRKRYRNLWPAAHSELHPVQGRRAICDHDVSETEFSQGRQAAWH